jgi:hypothetical protein
MEKAPLSDRPLRYAIATIGVVVGTLILLSGTTGDCGLDVECDGGQAVALGVLALAASALAYMFYRYKRKRRRR